MKNLVILLALGLILFPTHLFAQKADIEAKIKSVPPISYPSEASKTGLDGEVRVVVDIDSKGKVTKAYDATGPGWVCENNTRADVIAMRQIAAKAAERAVFTPAMSDGKPIASQMRLKLNFKNPSPKKTTIAVLATSDTNSGYRRDDGSSTIESGTKTTGRMTMTVRDVSTGNALAIKPGESTTTTETKTVSGAVLNGKAIVLPKPNYPAAARAIKAKGAVNVQVVIDTNGTIFTANPIAGHPLLQNAARIAACSSRFAPTLLSGEPVMVSGIITYNFVL